MALALCKLIVRKICGVDWHFKGRLIGKRMIPISEIVIFIKDKNCGKN